MSSAAKELGPLRPSANEMVPWAGDGGGGFQLLMAPYQGACCPGHTPALTAGVPPSIRRAVMPLFLFITPILQDRTQVSYLYLSFFASLPVRCKFLLHLKSAFLCHLAIDETFGLAFAL